MTKRELILLLENSPHSDETEVCIFLNEEEGLEDIIGDIAFIDSLDADIEDRLDINVIYDSYWKK